MNKDVLAVATLIAAALIVAATIIVRNMRELTAAPAAPLTAIVPAQSESAPATAPARMPPSTRPQGRSTVAAAIPSARSSGRRGGRAAGRALPPAGNIPISEPVARQALNSVGADPAANIIWIQAINDTNLPQNQRRNLIEDLNETGFSDPRNLTSSDLPLIESRMALIEQLAGDAVDDANAAAFEEAYRDLSNMRARIIGE